MPLAVKIRPVPSGVLLVDKPEGPTSHDVVNRARRSTGWKRIGHTGTLDPFATGLLVLCTGRATRLVSLFHDLEKRYDARMTLGEETDTDDRTGTVIRESEGWREVKEEEVCRLLEALPGKRLQSPPTYSARKVKGQRAYVAARAGKPLPLPPSPIDVISVQLRAFQPPTIDLTLVVSTGTYVRALARDLGRDLGCLAHLSQLRRTAIGPFPVQRAVSWEDLADPEHVSQELMTPAVAVCWIPVRRLSDEELVHVSHGGQVEAGEIEEPKQVVASATGEDRVLLLARGQLVAVGRRDRERIKPEKVFLAR